MRFIHIPHQRKFRDQQQHHMWRRELHPTVDEQDGRARRWRPGKLLPQADADGCADHAEHRHGMPCWYPGFVGSAGETRLGVRGGVHVWDLGGPEREVVGCHSYLPAATGLGLYILQSCLVHSKAFNQSLKIISPRGLCRPRRPLGRKL